MALTFVLGRPGSGKTTYCLDDITGQKSGHADPMFYIVPEQSSLQAERMLVSKSPGGAVMQVQALSFGRLAYHVFSRTGNAPVKQLNDTGKHMLLRKVLGECDLSFYARAVQMPGFIDSLSQTITEFSQYAVSPSDLELRARRSEDELGLSAKLMDLAAVFRRYREHITGQYLVTGETMELLAERLCDAGYLRGGIFWIDGFKDFTPGERQVIGHIMAAASHVTVTLTVDAVPTGDVRPYDFFYAAKRSFLVLSEMAKTLAIPINPPIVLERLHRYSNADMERLTQLFSEPIGSTFSFGKRTADRCFQSKECQSPGIKLMAVTDKAAELVRAAEWIRLNVAEKKRWRFRDIAVLCGDLAGYEKLARNIFSGYGIPFFVDIKMGVLSHPLTELIRAAFDVIIWDWQYEGVFRLLKTGFSGLALNEIDRLENYVLARGIKGWRWRVQWQDATMEDCRLRVTAMLAPLMDGLKADSEISVAGMAWRVYSWLYELDVPGSLTQLLEEAGGDQEQVRWHRQIWPRIAEIFDKLVEILGEERVTVKAYADILDAGFKSADLGMIPPSLDQVVMGDITRSRYPEIKGLWVLGANDGQLPSPIGTSSLLTEDERENLRAAGMELAPDLCLRMSDSLLALYSALCQPSDELVLSYSRAGPDGKPLRPSPILARIKKIFPNISEGDLCGEAGGTAVIPVAESSVPVLSPESAEILYGGSIYTAASRLEAYAECPFAYFMTYNLHAKERAIYQVRPMDLGILYHHVLAKATEELSQNNAWHDASREDLKKIVNAYAEEAVQGEADHVLQSSARNMYVLQSVKRICTVSLWALCEQYRRGSYGIAGIEIGTEGITIPLDSRHEMIVTGRIDRVDAMDDYIKIIDYKSGGTRFSMEEVQAGRQLQLLLYMDALLKRAGGTALPGGVFYFSIDDPILAVDEVPDPAVREAQLLKQFRMSGLTLADKDNIAGLDKHLLNRGGESPVIPVSLRKDGSFGKNSYVVNIKEFAELCKDAEAQVKRIGQQMIRGIIAPNPIVKGNKSPCRYCKYGAVCGAKHFSS